MTAWRGGRMAALVWLAVVLAAGAADWLALLRRAPEALADWSTPFRWAVLGANVLESLATVLLAAVMLGTFAGLGVPVLRWVTGRKRLDAPGLGLLAGAWGASAALAGALFVRLWTAGALTGLGAVLVLLALPGSGLIVRGAAAGITAARRHPWVAALFGLWLPWMTLPETHEDVWAYHFAAPDLWLAAHGLDLRRVGVMHHAPMVAEVLHAWPLLVGLDAVPRWIGAFGLAAGARVLLAGTASPWAWAFLATAATTSIVPTAKSDGFAAGCVLAAAGLALRGRGALPAAGLCAGLAATAKITAIPNLLWIPFAARAALGRARPAIVAGAAALAVLPLLPWLMKSWVVTGDPLYPWLLSGHAHGIPAPAGGWAGRACREAVREHAALGWWLPVAAVASARVRSAVVWPLLGWLGWFAVADTPHNARYALPSMLAAGCLGWSAATPGFPVPRLAAVLFALGAAVRLATAVESAGMTRSPVAWLAGTESRAEHVARGLTVLDDARAWLAARVRRPDEAVLLVGEWHAYRLPQPVRCAAEDLRGPPGLIHRIVASSRDESSLRKRLRQEGIGLLLYNPTRALNAAHVWTDPAWTRADTLRWAGFIRRWTEPVWEAPRLDAGQGTLAALALRRAPRETREPLRHLPGTEFLLAPALREAYAGRYEAAYRAARAALADLPPVLAYEDTVGTFAAFCGRHAEALAAFGPSTRAGWVDGENFFWAGIAAWRLGRSEAANLLARAAVVNPHRAEIAVPIVLALGLAEADRRLDRDPAGADRRAAESLAAVVPAAGGRVAVRLAGGLSLVRSVACGRLGRTHEARRHAASAAEVWSDAAALTPALARERWRSALADAPR